MVTCPDCNASVVSPEKTWSITGDIDENGIFIESQVGIYLCPQCSIKFPYAFSKDKLEIVKTKYLDDLRSQISNYENETIDLATQTKDLSSQIDKLLSNVTLLETNINSLKLEKEDIISQSNIEKLELKEQLLKKEISKLEKEKESLNTILSL